jgi:hypothetical protein
MQLHITKEGTIRSSSKKKGKKKFITKEFSNKKTHRTWWLRTTQNAGIPVNNAANLGFKFFNLEFIHPTKQQQQSEQIHLPSPTLSIKLKKLL